MPDSNVLEIFEAYAYLCVRNAAAAIEFYERAFGAVEQFRMTDEDDRIAHAEVTFGQTTIMLVDEYPGHGLKSPLGLGGTPARIHLHVRNVDALARQATEAGAIMLSQPSDEVHGERQCRLRDPFGHEWLLGHQTEELTRDEILERFGATRE